MHSSSPTAPQMVESGDKLSISSTNSSCCEELREELNKLRQWKDDQLQMLDEQMKLDIETEKHRYIEQIQQLNQQRTTQISNFKKYCIKELQKIKKEIQRSNQPNDINFDEIYNKWHRNQMNTRFTMNTRYFPPKESLEYDDIKTDLTLLFAKAKEKEIYIPQDFIPIKMPKERKYKVGVQISVSDRDSINDICSQIGIDVLERQLTVALYGYHTHLCVYKDIFAWIKQRDLQVINELKSGKLRDLQVKLASKGKVGKKNEMQNGIRIKLKELTKKFALNTL